MSVFQTERVGAAWALSSTDMPHQFKDSSVADTERHLSCKQVHVGAKPTGGSISNTLHIVTAAFLVVNEAVPVRIRLTKGEPISSSCARQRAEPAVRKTALPSASLGRTSTFHRIRESQRTRLVWDQDRPGAAPGYPTTSTCRAKGKESKSAAKCAANEFENSSLSALCPPLSQPCSSTVRASAFEAEGWWCESTRGCQFHARVVQQQRQPSQKRFSAGATPAVGTIFVSVAQ
jgi:hypothetical protein